MWKVTCRAKLKLSINIISLPVTKSINKIKSCGLKLMPPKRNKRPLINQTPHS